jgi:hypothetical protein
MDNRRKKIIRFTIIMWVIAIAYLILGLYHTKYEMIMCPITIFVWGVVMFVVTKQKPKSLAKWLETH